MKVGSLNNISPGISNDHRIQGPLSAASPQHWWIRSAAHKLQTTGSLKFIEVHCAMCGITLNHYVNTQCRTLNLIILGVLTPSSEKQRRHFFSSGASVGLEHRSQSSRKTYDTYQYAVCIMSTAGCLLWLPGFAVCDAKMFDARHVQRPTEYFLIAFSLLLHQISQEFWSTVYNPQIYGTCCPHLLSDCVHYSPLLKTITLYLHLLSCTLIHGDSWPPLQYLIGNCTQNDKYINKYNIISTEALDIVMILDVTGCKLLPVQPPLSWFQWCVMKQSPVPETSGPCVKLTPVSHISTHY